MAVNRTLKKILQSFIFCTFLKNVKAQRGGWHNGPPKYAPGKRVVGYVAVTPKIIA